jgi:hypothetical protein
MLVKFPYHFSSTCIVDPDKNWFMFEMVRGRKNVTKNVSFAGAEHGAQLEDLLG